MSAPVSSEEKRAQQENMAFYLKSEARYSARMLSSRFTSGGKPRVRKSHQQVSTTKGDIFG